ncbi:MAG: hypothetical protein GF344_04495 [Chitinivibrionales bacterium]|nr:hypothetical protein [Chitinivibrionales bacterium]MBD3356302.1 hypothetical protein [Chitinivibrionales bacterium]
MTKRTSRLFQALITGALLLIAAAPASAGFPVKMSATNDSILQFLGAENAKLVFIDRWEGMAQLCYIDFSEDTEWPQVHRIEAAKGPKDTGPKVPMLSPDGNWVVFCDSGLGGEHGAKYSNNSNLYLCRLEEQAQPILLVEDHAHEPRWMWRANTPTIVYPTHAFDKAWEATVKVGDEDIANPAETKKISVNLSTNPPQVGVPEVLFDGGGYTGGISWDNRYLCGAGGLVAIIDLQSSDPQPNIVGPIGFGTENAFGSQACNGSMSPSQKFPGTLCFLDFGSSHKEFPGINNGRAWTSWQLIHVTNPRGESVKHFGFPRNPAYPLETPDSSLANSVGRWHHPEWANHPYYITATLNVDRSFRNPDPTSFPLWKSASNQERIYLINAKDSAYIEVMRQDEETIEFNPGVGLHWPGLWVEIPAEFEEDTLWAPVLHEKGPAVKRGGISFNGTRIISPYPIRTITVYRANGSVVERISPEGHAKRIVLAQLHGLSTGTYFVRVETLRAGTQVFRYMPLR